MTLVHGPGWDSSRPIRQQDAWNEHAAFMDGLVDDGFIIIGGPLGDGSTSLHAVEAANEAHIRARLAADPWARMDLLRVGSIQPWALWLDSRQSSNVPDSVAVASGSGHRPARHAEAHLTAVALKNV
jgi:uncharacterized protein YciI